MVWRLGVAWVLAGIVGVVCAQSFERIDGGEGTGCGRGAEYSFFFRVGTVNKVVIEFEGGGGCWDVLTCLLPTWSTTVGGAPSSNGIRDNNNEDNPVRNWAHLYVPYCTGDVHLGAREAAGVNFNGRANAQAALDWLHERLPEPEVTLTTGCSAGALGSVAWAPWIAQRYPDARNIQFGDSYIGVTTTAHWRLLDENWDLISAFRPGPGMEPERLREYSDDICPYIISQSSVNYNVSMQQFTYNADSVQISFTALAGGPSLRWTEVMREIIPSTLAPDSGYYIADGSGHCTIPSNSLYSVTANGVRLIDWLAALVEDGSWERVVDCCGDSDLTRKPRQLDLANSRSDKQQWECAAAFAEHYRSAHVLAPNSTESAFRVVRQYRDFERIHCAPPQ